MVPGSDIGLAPWAPIFASVLFLGTLLFLEMGRHIGLRRLAADPIGASEGIGAVNGAVFGLMGLLIAFTFSGAAARFDARRQLIVEEANDIGTAYLRLDILPASAQPPLRDQFRRYVDSRLATYRKLPDVEAALQQNAKSIELQGEIWREAVAACRAADYPPAALLLLPALNAMIEITTTRTMATAMHPPLVIFVMLFGLAFASAVLAGYGMARHQLRGWLHMVAFAAVMSVTVYVIIDLEFPRLGLIRVDAFDRVLTDVRNSMN